MKRRLCAWVVGLVVLQGLWLAVAQAETQFDFSDMNLNELYQVREQLEAQIDQLEQQNGGRTYESGSYLVGRDIPAGDYVLRETQDAIFASVIVRADDTTDSELISYRLINHQVAIHFEKDTWVTISDAVANPLPKALEAQLENGVVYEGSYLVGKQIPAGRYIVSTMEKAPLSSYSIFDDILGMDAQLVKFEVLHDDALVELADGEYIELSGCLLSQAE